MVYFKINFPVTNLMEPSCLYLFEGLTSHQLTGSLNDQENYKIAF